MKHLVLAIVSLAIAIICLFTTTATVLVIAGLVFAVTVVIAMIIGARKAVAEKVDEALKEEPSLTKMAGQVFF